MPFYETTVAGDRCTMFVLPPARPDLIKRWRSFTHAADVFGFDVETTAIDEMQGMHEPDAKLRMVQFGTHRMAWCLDPHDPFWRAEIMSMLSGEAREARFVSHTNYDPLWALREFGIDLGERSLDTQIMARLLYPAARKTDLKGLTAKHIDRGLVNAETAMLERFYQLAPSAARRGTTHALQPDAKYGKALKAWGFTHIPLNDPFFGRYGGLDAIYVRRLLDIIARALKKEGMAPLSRREQRFGVVCTGISWRGQRVDKPYTAKLLREVGGEYNGARDRLEETFGFKALSPKRGNWLRAHGLTDIIAETPGGDVRLDKETLPLYAMAHEGAQLGPIFADMQSMSENKNLRTVLVNITQGMDANGIVHPKVWAGTAITGRSSIVRPALQTFKKTDPRHRGVLIARNDSSLVKADYDSQEIRIGAAFSNDPNFNEIVFNGASWHDITAAAIWGAQFTEAERGYAKNLNFAIQYGAGPKKIALMSKVSLADAREMWAIWNKTYRVFVAWRDKMATAHEIVNPWGRVIPRDPFRAYAMGNYAIQSTGRDLLGDAVINIVDAGFAHWIWLHVHDEIVLEVPHGREEEACALLERCMAAKIKHVPFTATAEVLGHRWSGKETA